MKVLVAVKRVVDYSIRVRARRDGTGVDTDNLKKSMNPFDEIAVEEALRLQEAGNAKETAVVSIGDLGCQETLRTALAMGIDRALHVETTAELEPLAVAKLLHAVVVDEQADLVILGKQAIDDDANQTGQMLAALLGWGQGTFACKLEFAERSLLVTREIDGGTETLELGMPAVVTTDLRLNTPRYVKLPNIIKAKKKPLRVLTPKDLNVDIAPRTRVLQVNDPAARKSGILVDSAGDLVRKLRSEAKVLR